MPFIHHINTKDQELTSYQTKQNVADFFRYSKDMTCPSTIDLEIMTGAIQISILSMSTPFLTDCPILTLYFIRPFLSNYVYAINDINRDYRNSQIHIYCYSYSFMFLI